jgi:molecular chaperone DnaK (HSP70)
MWGYNIPAGAESVQWFKLLLLREEDLEPEVRESEPLLRARKYLRRNKKSAIDLIADYLRGLWKHTLETISRNRGQTVINALRFHVVITVPAIWKSYARQDMKVAAEKAGILDGRRAGPTTLDFAPEPEAAALATLAEPGRSVGTGDVYVICDAGGGTVVSD